MSDSDKRRIYEQLNSLSYFVQYKDFDCMSNFDDIMENIKTEFPFVYITIMEKLMLEANLREMNRVVQDELCDAMDTLNMDKLEEK